MKPLLSVCRPMASYGTGKFGIDFLSRSTSTIWASRSWVNGFATKSDEKNPPAGNSNSKNSEKVGKNDSSSIMADKKETSSTLKSTEDQVKSKSKSGTSSTRAPSSGGDKKIKPEDYKVQEYFQYDAFTFYDVEKDMVKDRMKQPDPSVKEGMAPVATKK